MSEGDSLVLGIELEQALQSGFGPKIARFALAILSGVPGVGGVFSGAAGAWSEADQAHFNRIVGAWLRMQEEDLRNIARTLGEVASRVDIGDAAAEARMSSPEYVGLVKKAFREWSAGDSEEKRRLVRNLLANAASANQLCGDDILKLFLDWIDRFTEKHFEVIRVVHQNIGATRSDIWGFIHGEPVREDSAEADIFKLLVQDLSMGHVIRQHREVDYYGNFLKAPRARKAPTSATLKSAFADDKAYELTELGRWFVHYTMNEIVPRLSAGMPEASAE